MQGYSSLYLSFDIKSGFQEFVEKMVKKLSLEGKVCILEGLGVFMLTDCLFSKEAWYAAESQHKLCSVEAYTFSQSEYGTAWDAEDEGSYHVEMKTGLISLDLKSWRIPL